MHTWGWLTEPAGVDAIAAAEAALAEHSGELLASGASLRRRLPHLTAEQAAAALEQATLRQLAGERYGIDAARLLLTRGGLEQATRPSVARQRAVLLRDQGVRRVVDLTAGLGFDAAALSAAGLDVTAVERDAATAAFCRTNVPQAEVIHGEAADVITTLLATLAPTDVVFVDPGRRSGARDVATGRARPERDPERWSPPWSFVAALPHPRVAMKAAPSFEPPTGWVAQWSSVDRDLVECLAMSWPALGTGRVTTTRRAVCHHAQGWDVLDADGAVLPVASTVGPWLLEPDPAVLRARGLSALPADDLQRVDEASTWLTSDEDPSTATIPFGRAYRVVAELSGSRRQQRAALRRLGIDRLTVKNRDVPGSPHAVLADLGCREGNDHILVMTPRAGRTLSLLVDPVPARRA